MNEKNKNTLNKKIIIPVFCILIILLSVIIGVIVLHPNNKTTKTTKTKNLTVEENKGSKSKVKVDIISNGESNSFIKLNVGNKEKLNGGESLEVNDYKLFIPDKLVKIGYDLTIENNALRIKSKDNLYECILVQLSDSYVMPTEEEQDAYFETNEYKKLIEEYYNDNISYEQYSEKEDILSTNYFKKIGYTAQNAPDYILTAEELKTILGKYYKEGESNSYTKNGMFPGYEYIVNYDWGNVIRYSIPKYYKDSTFGEETSEFSICLYIFEYYNSSKVDYNVGFWQY